MASRAAPDKLAAVSALTSLLLQLALATGASIGLAGHRVGAWLMVAAVIGFLLSHLSIGLISCHRTMSRPWPKVPPPSG